jgi:drug/metabolite transporter (DMT)-like permease
MSLLATAVYYFAFAKGAALLPSSIAGLLSGAIPLFTFVCTWLFPNEERIDTTKLAGVGLGILGVLLIARLYDRGLAQRGMFFRLCPSIH